MQSPINKVPVGLLSLLGIQAVGENPKVLNDVVQPVIDLTEMYSRDPAFVLNQVTSGINATLLFSWPAVAPPQGQMWVFENLNLSVTAAIGAGTTLRGRAVVFEINALSVLHFVADDSGVISGTTGERPCAGIRGPVVVRHGQQLGFFVEAIVGAGAPVVRLTGGYNILNV